MSLTPVVAIEVLVLSFVANAAPIIGARLLGSRWSAPIDGGMKFVDGRPLLGASKTIRGVVLSSSGCAVVALLFGYTWQFGCLFGLASMAGDALSSFIKRRLDIPPSGRFLGLDQVPEILLPLLLCARQLHLDGPSILLLSLIFVAGSLLLSRVGHALGLKKRPY